MNDEATASCNSNLLSATLSLIESQKQSACHVQGHTESVWQSQESNQSDTGFLGASVQQRTAFHL